MPPASNYQLLSIVTFIDVLVSIKPRIFVSLSSACGLLLSILLDCAPSTAGGLLGARSIHASLRFETKVPVRPLVAERPENGICVENDVTKTPEVGHPWDPVLSP